MAVADDYKNFIEHPRYGRRPRITGLNPETDYSTGKIFLHWHSPGECRIPNTAIPADLTRQSRATVPVTHYFDVKRLCRDCGKPFIFFAEEQRHRHKELGFALESDCVRCVVCRKKQQGLELARERYEELMHIPERTITEHLEMAECCLLLIEAGIFHKRQLEHVRMILKKLPEQLPEIQYKLSRDLWQRVNALENENNC
jgi:hypothetical protein